MKVLLTSILCQSGLMTHVHDLLQYLRRHSLPAAVAFLKSNYATPEEAAALRRLEGVEIWEYEEDRELVEIAEAAQCDLLHAHSYLTFNAVRRLPPWAFLLSSHCTLFTSGVGLREALAQAERIIAVAPPRLGFGAVAKKDGDHSQRIDLEILNLGWMGKVGKAAK